MRRDDDTKQAFKGSIRWGGASPYKAGPGGQHSTLAATSLTGQLRQRSSRRGFHVPHRCIESQKSSRGTPWKYMLRMRTLLRPAGCLHWSLRFFSATSPFTSKCLTALHQQRSVTPRSSTVQFLMPRCQQCSVRQCSSIISFLMPQSQQRSVTPPII